ncbi:MAG: flagellar biosynthesis protein FlhF [bacterium]
MIKKFKAPNMKDAMKMVKESLGENAVILQTRKINRGGLFDIMNPQMVEITAIAENQHVTPPAANKLPKGVYSPPSVVKRLRGTNTNHLATAIKAELKDLKDAVIQVSDYLHFSKMLLLPESFRYLVNRKGVDEDLAVELVQKVIFKLSGDELQDKSTIKEALSQQIKDCLKVAGKIKSVPGRPKIVLLVGPTGMGKTTTIIKLATHPQFYGSQRVALITIDTYRVAAAAQLKTFATLAKLPLEVVYEPEDFARALEAFKSYAVILVDTAGRSPLNEKHLQDLKSFLTVGVPDEVHLVLSVSMRADNLLDAARNFSSLPVSQLIFSKLDETPRIGNILNVAQKLDLPISFLTNGQNVPEDILLAKKNYLADCILG